MTAQMQEATPRRAATVSLDEQRVKRIVAGIRAEDERLRAKYPILQRQNAIGLSILLFSLAGMIASGLAWYLGYLSAWISIPLSALFASLSHELEHDLIHRLYFRKQPLVQNIMMFVVWVMRPNTINPWYRRGIHFLHHKVSGNPEDLEERLVGNGIRNPILRLVVMADSFMGILLRVRVFQRETPRFDLVEIVNASFPVSTMYYVCWYVFLGYHAVMGGTALLGVSLPLPAWTAEVMSVLNLLVVVVIAPNVLRAFCLNVITSYMHYYGGVSGLMQQTQILRPWFLWPLQLFCFNFGSTHAIHHFVVNQPFYLRQMVAGAAHRVMRENGVRYNDLSTFVSGNRYQAIRH